MRDFDVQTVEIEAPFEEAFRYIADPGTLPEWTHAFRSVTAGRAQLVTPQGSVDIGLEVTARREAGTVDWTMTFPDGSVARAFSRLVDHGGRTLYSFVLLAPPVPLEQLEGALAQQSQTLREELKTLQRKLARA
jgi:uncharacterized protein YndB with AHSA1/START domain